MNKLIILSNRLPIKIQKKSGNVQIKTSIGGLATGIRSFSEGKNIQWIGWPGIANESLSKKEIQKVRKDLKEESLYPLFLSQSQIKNYYQGFCNRALWPLFHYFIQNARYDRHQWESYVSVNNLFLRELKKVYHKGDLIWIHDYHLMLLPRMVREALPKSKIGFFLHIPFPSYEVFRLFPWKKELLQGLLGSSQVGFHTYDYATHFLKSVRRIVGYNHELGRIDCGDRICKVEAFPMGIDFHRFYEGVEKPTVKREISRIKGKLGHRKIILSIDRMDYSKGIPQRIEAFDRFLTKYPNYRGKVSMIIVAVPSRVNVEQYRLLKKTIDELVGRVDGKYGTIGWTPIWYINRYISFNQLLALYRLSDVALITPLRDGMNLIAKEFISSKVDGKGVLILSEMAGSSRELSEAIIINPNDIEIMADAIDTALQMEEEIQIQRNRSMQKRLKRYDVRRWGEDFIDSLNSLQIKREDAVEQKLKVESIREIKKYYEGGCNRLIIIDDDDIISPETLDLNKYKIPRKLSDIITRITDDKNNHLFFVSGKDRNFLDSIFIDRDVSLCAEHGVWIRKRGGIWIKTYDLNNRWKTKIRPVLDLFTDRTPGSYIEEKDYSLVWNYKSADPDLSSVRSKELVLDLTDLIEKMQLCLIDSEGAIEIKHAFITKSLAVKELINQGKWDFILALSGRSSDESIYGMLPKSAFSVKVGLTSSRARYNLETVDEVEKFLNELTR